MKKSLTVMKHQILVGLLLLIISQPLFGQQNYDNYNYPPISYDVPFHIQETQVWCWVAAAKMITEYYAREEIPNQCQMLEIAYGAPCCQNPAICERPGHITEIQNLIQRFGGRVSEISPPTNGFLLYEQLKRGPIVLYTAQGNGHFVVATGMRVVSTLYGPLGMITVNDPYYGQYEIDYPSLMQAWVAAIVVY